MFICNWPSNRIGVGPSTPKSIANCSLQDAAFCFPFGKAHRFSGVGQQMVGSPVAALLLHRGPSAVARFVVSVVIDSIKRQAGRLNTHVREKVSVNHPPFANGNSATSIMVKIFVFWIAAPIFHRPPNLVRCLAQKPVGATARAVRDLRFPHQASATAYSLRNQVSASTSFRSSAVAETLPKRISRLVGSLKTNDHQSVKSSPNQVFEFGAVFRKINFSHDGSSPLRLEPRGGYSHFAACSLYHKAACNG